MDHNKVWLVASFGILLLLSSSIVAIAQQYNEEVPEEIVIESHNLFPEGIEYDEEGQRFLVGSFDHGTVYQVTDDGTILMVIEDEELQSTAGIEVDRTNNRLLVANNTEDQAWLSSYDLESGERIFRVNLSDLYPADMHLANDVAVDIDGIAYVTDTFAPVIYRVDTDGNATLLIEDKSLAWINGIVAHPDGYLLLGAAINMLLKIPIDTLEITPVELGGNVEFDVTDGMVLRSDDSLITVTFPDSIIYELQTDDGWKSATLAGISSGHETGWGTTVALRGEEVYVIHSYLHFMMEELGDRDIFEIQRVEFSLP